MMGRPPKSSGPCFCLALLCVTIVFTIKGDAQDDEIRVNTDLVTVPVAVVDRNGRYLPELRKENFRVFENGVEQQVEYFEPIQQPFTVLLLLDSSGSMHEQKAKMVSAVNLFLSKLRPDDEVIAFEYAHLIKNILSLTKAKNISTPIKVNKWWGGEESTVTFDAVELALKKMKKIRGRKAIILFSDGEQYGKGATARSNLEDAEEQEAMIYTILFKDFSEWSQTLNKEKYASGVSKIMNYMRGLPRLTGARYFHIDEIDSLDETFIQIAEELGQQYRIGYYPNEIGKRGERRRIKVQVNVPGAAIRARDSYVAGANTND
jgi:Ca-activated chloride channel homolog